MKTRGIVNKNKQQFCGVCVYVQFLTDQIFTLGRFRLLLFKIDNVKKKNYWGHRTYNLFLTSSYLKMASRNKLLPVWGIHVIAETRGGVYT